MEMPTLVFAAAPGYRDPEPWGRALSYSTLAHAALAVFFLTFTVTQKPILQTVLTEIHFMEQQELIEETGVGSGGGETQAGFQLGAPGQAQQVESHTNLKNVVPYSSPNGSPNGSIVTAEPMSGPTVNSGEIGLIGNRKGKLMPLAGHTEGRKSSEPLLVPAGAETAKDHPIALSVESVSELRGRKAGTGAPVISKRAILESTGNDKLKKLASADLGQGRALNYEKLKANPLDDEKWGKDKGPFSMEGPLKYRKILKMIIPPYPRWAEEQGLEASVSIRLWVNPKGRVKDNFYLEKASGFTELDQLAKDALRQFVFVTLPDTATQEDEWGVATFRFELKK